MFSLPFTLKRKIPETSLNTLLIKVEQDLYSRNHRSINYEIYWLTEIIRKRADELLYNKKSKPFYYLTEVPILYPGTYGDFCLHHQLSAAERLTLILTFAASYRPDYLWLFFVLQPGREELFSEFGGYLDYEGECFTPSLQTALFLLAGKDTEVSTYYSCQLYEKSQLTSLDVIRLKGDGPFHWDISDHRLEINPCFAHYFQTGEKPFLPDEYLFADLEEMPNPLKIHS